MKMKKKILSFLLAAAVVLGAVIPASLAYAQGPGSGNVGADTEGVETSKTVVDNGDGTYTLRLESYVTGETTTTTTQKPTDTVLVLDTSGSMEEYINVADKGSVADLDPQYAEYYKWNGGLVWHDMRYQDGKWQYKALDLFWKDCGNSWFGDAAGIQKINALKIAANEFIDSTAAKEGDNRIAIVTYATGATTRNQLTDVSTGSSSLKSTIDGLRANGQTNAEYGMQEAEEIINGISSDRNSVKTVVMFTDGEPNHGSGFDTSVANATISAAKDMKDAGATVYTVGVFERANPMDYTDDFNKYLHHVSSNYLNATSVGNGGELNPKADPFNGGKSYYMAADNLQSLSDIFESISDEIGGAAAELDENTVVQDVISDYFQLSKEANNVVVKTADCNRFEGDSPVWENEQIVDLIPTVDGRTIRVSGFDFSENWVGKNETTGAVHPGKKLIIEIQVELREGFLGGNNVPTNGAASGIYAGDELVESFTVPTVNVPIEPVTVTATDKNVYLMSNLTADQLKASATVKVGDVALDLSKEDYGLTWQDDYVNIAVNATAEPMNDLVQDGNYALAVTVSPKDEPAAEGTPAEKKTGEATAKINVFKPEITWKDSQLNVGETADYEKQNFAGVEWKHDTVAYDEDKMVGKAPELVYEYAPQADAFTQETKVNVTVKIGGSDVTQNVTFVHEKCDFDGCAWNGDCEFIVHIKSFDLTITKTGCEAIDENQSFIFTVTGSNGFTMQVVINGNGSKTIKGLPSGTYTVTEDTNWSWRYEPDEVSKTVTAANIQNGKATVNFANNRAEESDGTGTDWKWLNGGAYCENIFYRTIQ